MNASLPARLFVWLVIQLIALAVGVLGFQLSTRQPNPPESLTTHILLIEQMAVLALAFAWLLPTVWHAIAMGTTGMAFLFVAGWVSAQPLPALLWAELHVSMWLAALAGVNQYLNRYGDRRRVIEPAVTALIGLWAIGGAILHYFANEFEGRAIGRSSPIISAVQTLGGEPSLFGMFGSLTVLVLTILAVRVSRQ
jgi:hypothetical protein